MNLELKEIVGYLPYKLQMTRNGFVGELLCIYTDKIFKVSCSKWHESLEDDNFYKPILRPLSDLKNDIEVNGIKIIPTKEMYNLNPFFGTFLEMQEHIISSKIDIIPYWIIQKLYEWHFDIHNLINRGLAIDINTLKS